MKKQTHKPKRIIIQEDGEDYKVCREWPGGKISAPQIITSNVGELVDEYRGECEKYGLIPDMKLILSIVNKQTKNSKEVNNGPNDFLKGYFD